MQNLRNRSSDHTAEGNNIRLGASLNLAPTYFVVIGRLGCANQCTLVFGTRTLNITSLFVDWWCTTVALFTTGGHSMSKYAPWYRVRPTRLTAAARGWTQAPSSRKLASGEIFQAKKFRTYPWRWIMTCCPYTTLRIANIITLTFCQWSWQQPIRRKFSFLAFWDRRTAPLLVRGIICFC